MIKTVVLAAAAVGFLLGALPSMADRVLPPLEALRHPNLTLVVVERLDAPVVDHRMPLRVVERLRGDPDVPDEIELLVQAADDRIIETGKIWLVFYTDVERVNFKPGLVGRRPDRRSLVRVEGADPAVFPDTSAMRELLGPEHAGVEEGAHYRDVVIEGMHSDDPAMVDLWSAEWALRPGIFPEISPDQVSLLRGIVEDAAQRPSARARILFVAGQRTPPELGPWYATSATVVLEETNPAQLSEGTGLSQLIYASLRVVQNNPEAGNAPILKKWLRTTPPLAENAALALRAIDPELEREAVVSAIADEAIPEQTRTFLSEHLRRLTLADTRSQ